MVTAVKEKNPKLLYTKDVAHSLKIDPKTLRRILRTQTRYKSNEEYNRYEWNPDNAQDAKFLKSLPAIVANHVDAEKEKKSDKKTEKSEEKPAAKKAAKKKAAPKKKTAKKEPPKPKTEPESESPLDSEEGLENEGDDVTIDEIAEDEEEEREDEDAIEELE